MSRERTLFTQLARAGLHLEALQVECLEPVGLTFTEYSVLRVLGSGPMSPSRLADAVVRTTGGMTKLLDRLSRRNLVERVPDPADGRGVLVRLTPDGHELSAKASASYSVGRDRILRRLGAADRKAIDVALSRLVEVFEDDRRSA
jgi:DNA-binding MarR family transcriptional regulator